MVMDDAPKNLYRQILPPGSDLADHARQLGINLKTKDIPGYRTPSAKGLRRGSPRPRSALQQSGYKMGLQYPIPSYIHNVVVPLTTEDNTNRSLYSASGTMRSFSRSKSAVPGFPQVVKRSTTPTTYRPMSAYSEHLTSVPAEYNYLTSQRQKQERQRISNSSEQHSRFEQEQQSMSQARTLKRTSEISSHRVDRMYYMSGTPLHIQQRYRVDDDELQRLQNLSRARKQTKHYGRGLSKYRYMGFPTETMLPRSEDFTAVEHRTAHQQMLQDEIAKLGIALRAPEKIMEEVNSTLREKPDTQAHKGNEEYLTYPSRVGSPELRVYNMEFVPSHRIARSPANVRESPVMKRYADRNAHNGCKSDTEDSVSLPPEDWAFFNEPSPRPVSPRYYYMRSRSPSQSPWIRQLFTKSPVGCDCRRGDNHGLQNTVLQGASITVETTVKATA